MSEKASGEPGATRPAIVRDDAQATPPPRVLIVDDEPTIRIALARFFTRLGWAVDEAGSGETALAMLFESGTDADHPDYRLVISDVRMPGLSGIDLHNRLEERRPDILPRLILSSGDLVSDEMAEFLATAKCVVLAKPFELSALLTTVNRVADRPSADEAATGT
jgi:DNA-binding response OmpR family regulator